MPKVKARIARTSNELDPRPGRIVELEIDNSDHFLVPGAFAYVTLHVPMQSYPEIPVAGLIVRGTRTLVADIGDDQTVPVDAGHLVRTDSVKAALGEAPKSANVLRLTSPMKWVTQPGATPAADPKGNKRNDCSTTESEWHVRRPFPRSLRRRCPVSVHLAPPEASAKVLRLNKVHDRHN